MSNEEALRLFSLTCFDSEHTPKETVGVGLRRKRCGSKVDGSDRRLGGGSLGLGSVTLRPAAWGLGLGSALAGDVEAGGGVGRRL
ncbi:hypothetical protein CMV_001601 [Castanea mollissima]|uniref:Uncharacterized protein n=1 Tax=Castanea mollissima TaxID=60419 RepID=A0A8J4RXF8_9ROSI|nr:hypothetical protein CMV_001601 [Castanea mollissima]